MTGVLRWTGRGVFGRTKLIQIHIGPRRAVRTQLLSPLLGQVVDTGSKESRDVPIYS